MNCSSSTMASGGSASAAVAMANNAIENARKAAASSRKSRKSGSKYKSFSGLGASKSSGADSSNFDLMSNDNAYHVIATLVTDRLLPKLQARSTYYTLTKEDRAFFQKMLPYSVRRKFVDALRDRLQMIKNKRVKNYTALENLTKQCQMLGLDGEETNALLDLSNSEGVTYLVRNEDQDNIPMTSSYELQDRPYAHANDYVATTQQPSMYGASVDQGASYGMVGSPMVNDGYKNPSIRDFEATAESLARQQIMAEINETKFLMKGSVTPEAKMFWQKHLNELNKRLVSLNMEEQDSSEGVGNNEFQNSYNVEPQVNQYAQYASEPPTPTNTTHHKEDQKEKIVSPRHLEKTCEVVAPSDLPGGYMFEAQLGSRKFLATVPSGGVTKGQNFVSTMKEMDAIEIPVFMGGWKDGVFECFNAGICHPLLLNGLLFPCSEFLSLLYYVFCFFAILLQLTNLS